MKTINDFIKEKAISIDDMDFYNSFLKSSKSVEFPLGKCYFISWHVEENNLCPTIFFITPETDIIGNFTIKSDEHYSIRGFNPVIISKIINIISNKQDKLNKIKSINNEFKIYIKCTMNDDFHMVIEECDE